MRAPLVYGTVYSPGTLECFKQSQALVSPVNSVEIEGHKMIINQCIVYVHNVCMSCADACWKHACYRLVWNFPNGENFATTKPSKLLQQIFELMQYLKSLLSILFQILVPVVTQVCVFFSHRHPLIDSS